MLKKKRSKKLRNPPRTNNNKSRSRKGKEVEVERRVVEVEAALNLLQHHQASLRHSKVAAPHQSM